MLKHQHNEFPSDLFLLLDAVGAQLVIADSNETSLTVSVKEFLKIKMNLKFLENIILNSLDKNRFTFKSYKVCDSCNFIYVMISL